MMRARFLRSVAPFAVVLLLLVGCGDAGDDAADTTLAATTTAAEATTTTAVTTTTAATTTTTQPPTTTTTEPENVFAAPEVYEQVAWDYCAQWPDIEPMLTDDANYAEVTGDRLNIPERNGFSKGVSDDVVVGRDAVAAAVTGEEGVTVQCGAPAVVSGDWVALPVTSASEDGSGTVGIWALRIVRDHVQWHFALGTPTTDTPPPDAIPNAALVAEAREFCAIIEGTDYVRSAEDFLGAMTDDPAVHNNAEGLYWTGIDEVDSMMESYPKSDQIWCGDEIITNGEWSAEPITIDNPPYNLRNVGIMVRHHVEGQIHSEFPHFTRESGEIAWGLPLEDLED